MYEKYWSFIPLFIVSIIQRGSWFSNVEQPQISSQCNNSIRIEYVFAFIDSTIPNFSSSSWKILYIYLLVSKKN